ncbi:YqcI/YcgG family protein [Bacillus taeanensis]|uniref:YqcI/YcgG family protein n=1 Tax=Bacillus taeanensis TaxID=273032 RepID=A0A366XWV8_9BACI|nr:YqcI/YcgG family protein [Bacillus taeanensis]RBW69249.1 hypothetical protein DS031_12790 [Bacillus taeanensis]
MTELYKKSWLEENLLDLPKWQRDAFLKFANMINDDANTYPCVPGRQGFQLDHLRFGFSCDPRKSESYYTLAALLKQYSECSRDTGKYASLVVIFETPEDLTENASVEMYENLFWTLLNETAKLDEAEWPENIPDNPSHHSWEFCFNGEPFFAFCATPAHVIRKSRHFPYFILAFQPRWVFEKVNDSTPFGKKIKKAIRKRLVNYDGIPAHPSLKWYGQKDNHEWEQYFLRDDDTSLSKCPFSRMKHALNKLRF